MDSRSEFLKDHFFNMHGIPAGADVARYVESEATKLGGNINIDAIQELDNKMQGSASFKYKPELPLHIKYCESMVRSLQYILRNNNGSKERHIFLIKDCDKFVSRFMSNKDECHIDKYLETLLKE